MKINPVKSSSYKEVLPQYIVDYIQKYAQDINDTVNPKTENNSIIKNKLKNCDKTQLKMIVAELETVQKRLDYILYGQY